LDNNSDEHLKQLASEAMDNVKWAKATTYLSSILDNSRDPQAAYNLIVCYIKLEDPFKSQAMLNKYKDLLKPEELKEMQEAIYKIPTKMSENELKGLAWYKSNMSLNDVIGLGSVKKAIKEKIILPMQNSALYKEYGINTGGGFVLYGPPGTGKTLLAKAIAGETNIRMLIANVKELVSKFQGESSKNISNIFNQARQGGPAIIFFDELDALAQSRTSSNVSSTGGEDRRIANALLTELDGAQTDNSNVYVIGATNMPWELDDAVMRSGRFNSFIYVPPPNLKERAELFKYYTKKLKIGRIAYMKLALMTFGFSPADIAAICKSSAEHALAHSLAKNKQAKPLGTKDFIWGIRQFPEPPLFKSYASALESLRHQAPARLQQFIDIKKDITFFIKNGKQRNLFYNVIAKIA
jgi:SpoVK/Ycf46/Vps4 family AAA+-type ATPase